MTSRSGGFQKYPFPSFWSYPPYFTSVQLACCLCICCRANSSVLALLQVAAHQGDTREADCSVVRADLGLLPTPKGQMHPPAGLLLRPEAGHALTFLAPLQIYKLLTSAAAEDRLFVNSDISSELLPITLGMPAAHLNCMLQARRCRHTAAGRLNQEAKTCFLSALVVQGACIGAALDLCLPLVCICRGLQASRTLVGHALWLDKAHSQCLVLWKRLPEWAEVIYTFAQTYGLNDSVMTVDDLSDSEDTANTGSFRNLRTRCMLAVLQATDMRLCCPSLAAELQGVPSELLMEAIKLLEGRGKAKLFRSQEGEMGVKFFS